MLTHRNRSKLFAKRASHVSGYVRSTDTLFVYGGKLIYQSEYHADQFFTETL